MVRRTNERPSPPGEGPFGDALVSRRLASVPSHPSVLPPGAGNEPKKPIKPEAKEREERYVSERLRLDGHMHAATVRCHDDGDGAAVLPIETGHMASKRCVRAVGTVRSAKV